MNCKEPALLEVVSLSFLIIKFWTPWRWDPCLVSQHPQYSAYGWSLVRFDKWVDKHPWVHVPHLYPFVLGLRWYGPSGILHYETRMTERVKMTVKRIRFPMKIFHDVMWDGVHPALSGWFCDPGSDPFLPCCAVSPFEKWVGWTRWCLWPFQSHHSLICDINFVNRKSWVTCFQLACLTRLSTRGFLTWEPVSTWVFVTSQGRGQKLELLF